ncbi:MAG: exosortase/archaeosortase family protein [Armatimonadota bacterium]
MTGTRRCLSILSKNYVLLIALVLLIAGQYRSVGHFWHIWDLKDSYYSHGPIVPVLAGVMVWLRRDKLSGIKASGSWLGLPILLLGCVMYLTTVMFAWKPLYGVAFFLAVIGVVWSTVGYRALKGLLAPIVFLITMIPLPSYFLDKITGKFTLIASALAAGVFQIAGHSITREGNVLLSPDFPAPLVVGGACSGLKLFIALVMSSIFLMFVLEGARVRKLLLLAMSLPFAIILNGLRIILIGTIGICTFSSSAVHKFHDTSGYIVLVIGAFAVLGFARLIGLKHLRDPESHKELMPWKPVRVTLPFVCAMLMLAVLAPLGFAIGRAYDNIPKGTLLKKSIPLSFDGWHGSDLEIDESTKERLAKGDLMSRAYVSDDPAAPSVQVLVNVSADLAAFHNPYDCLPRSGVKILQNNKEVLHINKPYAADFNVTVLHIESDSGPGIMLYWYKYGDTTIRSGEELRMFDYRNRLGDVVDLLASPGSLSKVQHRIQTREITWFRFFANVSDYESGEKSVKEFVLKFLSNMKDSAQVKHSMAE